MKRGLKGLDKTCFYYDSCGIGICELEECPDYKQKGKPNMNKVNRILNTLWKQEFGEDFNTKEKVQVHTLKTWPEPFQAVWDGKKPWEYRNNDRNFKKGRFWTCKRLCNFEPGKHV